MKEITTPILVNELCSRINKHFLNLDRDDTFARLDSRTVFTLHRAMKIVHNDLSKKLEESDDGLR